MHGSLLCLIVLLGGAGHSTALNCEGVERWGKDSLVREAPEGGREVSLTAEELRRGRDLVELDLECFGVAPTSIEDAAAMRRHPEGDLAYSSMDEVIAVAASSTDLRKSALQSRWRQWPQGVVHYTIDSRYGPYSRALIAKAMSYIEDNSCIRFQPRTSQRDYISILPDNGCYSYVGRVGGRQTISIDNGCVQKGTITHELLHSIGFFHEQSRPDRDDYVKIVWENLSGWQRGLPKELQSSEVVQQFAKYPHGQVAALNVGYDYGSILHYGPYAYSQGGSRTIVGKKSGSEAMGQRHQMSSKDISKLNRLYKCPNAPTKTGNSVDKPPKVQVVTGTKPQPQSCRNTFQGLCDVWRWLSSDSAKCRNGLARRFCRAMCNLC